MILYTIKIPVGAIVVIKAKTVALDFVIEWVFVILEKMEIDIHAMPLDNRMPVKFNNETLPANLFTFLQPDFKFLESTAFNRNHVGGILAADSFG